MSEDPNPYRAPASDPGIPLADPGPRGRLWRVEGNRLLVRDQAVLPDVCMLGGSESEPGKRVLKKLRSRGKKIQIQLFRSDRAARKALIIMLVLVAGIQASTDLPVLYFFFSSSPEALGSWRHAIIATLIVVSFAPWIAWYATAKGFVANGIVDIGDGWYHYTAIYPRTVNRLRTIQKSAPAEYDDAE